jgi:anti-sigma factor RsiW
MTTHEEFEERLSDYLDGELTDSEQRAVAAHLAECASCARTLRDLDAVVRTAAALPPAAPSADLWAGIAARLEAVAPRPAPAGGTTWRFTFSLPQLAAASVALAVLSGWAAMQLTTRTAPAPLAATAAPAASPAASEDPQVVQVSLDDAEYDEAVADLRTALDKGRGTLDPATVAIIEENLKTINQAVDDARAARAADPANGFLSGYLVDTRRRQLDLLRHAAALAGGAD